MESGASTRLLWHALLKRRVTHRWGNFSWLSLNTLLLSANDALAKLDASIVDTRRMRWVAAQRARGIDPHDPVAFPDARSLVALGDPGEMDASQYVLVRDLVHADPDVLLLMSDIVYPAGDVNAWRDAVYLPYLGLPEAAWQGANAAASRDDAIPSWHVLASPGNHDWYDGLTGFMYHACGAESLPPVTFSKAGLKPAQRLTRRIWQDPARPNRQMLAPLRAQTAARWPVAAPPGPMPWQPGPYFAIDLGDTGTQAAVRLVAVDTGVDGSIDVEQALWVRHMLAGPVPKIVVTGKPLVTGNRVKDIPVNHAEPPPGSIQDQPDDLPTGLRELLAEGDRVVATLAGDIHNSQRLVLAGTAVGNRRDAYVEIDDAVLADAREQRLPPVQIVAGGGGAYLSETHTTKFTASGGLRLEGDEPLPAELPWNAHSRFPDPKESVRVFARRVGRVAGGVLLAVALLALGTAAAIAWLAEAGEQVCVERECVNDLDVVAAPFTLFALVAFGWLTWAAAKGGKWGRALVLFVIALAAAYVFRTTWNHQLEFAPVLVGALAVGIVAPVLPLLIPLLQFFPALARLVPLRTLVVAAVGLLLQQRLSGSLDNLALVIALVALAIGFVGLASRFVAWLLRRIDDLASDRREPLLRGFFAVCSLWPVGFLVAAIWLIPGDREGWLHARHAAAMIVLIELELLLAGLLGVAFKSLWAARRTAPVTMLVLAAVATLAGGVAGGAFAAVELGDPWLVVLLAAAGAASAGALAPSVVLAASTGAVTNKAIKAALAGRTVRNRHLFRLMSVAATPGISEIAEAAEPPFHKSFLEITYETANGVTTSITFASFGVDHERGSVFTDTQGVTRRASARRVDRLVLRLG